MAHRAVAHVYRSLTLDIAARRKGQAVAVRMDRSIAVAVLIMVAVLVGVAGRLHRSMTVAVLMGVACRQWVDGRCGLENFGELAANAVLLSVAERFHFSLGT